MRSVFVTLCGARLAARGRGVAAIASRQRRARALQPINRRREIMARYRVTANYRVVLSPLARLGILIPRSEMALLD